jgi:methionine-rich copper-binding protein CopC
VKRLVVGLLVMLVGALLQPSTGSAHTDFDYSLPTQDASVAAPVSEITVAFTQPVALVGNGFEVLNPQGEIVLPTPITDDDQVFRLILDQPVAGGQVGVRYEVTSLDGHVVQGGFSFVVDAAVPTTTVPPTTASPTTPAPAPPSTPSSVPAPATVPATAAATSTSTTAAATTAATTTTAASTSAPPSTKGDDDSGSDTGFYAAIAAIVAAAAVGFVAIRARNAV